MDSGTVARFAQVVVLAQLGRAGGLFTYRLPDALLPLVRPGVLVAVPFTNRRLQGVVWSLESECHLPRVRDVEEVLDPVPVLTDHQHRLADWIAGYYGAPLSDVVGAMLPPALGRKTVYRLELANDSTGSRLTPAQREILDALEGSGCLLQEELRQRLTSTDLDREVASLVRRNLITRTAELAPPRATAHLVHRVSATATGQCSLDSGEGLKRAPKRRAVLEEIVKAGSIPVPELAQRIPGASAVVAELRKRDLVTVEVEERRRMPIPNGKFPRSTPLDLSPAQRIAADAIVKSLGKAGGNSIFLLHGVTGSGKTEVYLQSIERTLAAGHGAIMMVPEISLTPQAVERVAGRFPGQVAVLHSKLSEGERLDEWQRIRHGEVGVVVGPRSALFAPLPHPGLIVVDEEHDPSYKQDASPRYNARDAAAVLGRLTGATVVFGSATPDIGTYYAAQQKRIKILELPDRPVWGKEGARPMPPVEIVDMRHELKAGNRSMFSRPLLDALNETLEQQHQALLFLNRRGSATVVLCRDCGYVVRCPNCDIPFTFHTVGMRLICHRCDKRAVSPRTCPRCESPRIRYLGAGTQKVEEEVGRLFPRARVLRWDRDVTGGKEAHEDLLQRFARHEADILVGTQMIAKGLDFPLVTLVGVISADTGLHMPDFRAPERSFQLLTQVAGRAGRASLPSRVVVQTYTPDHYAIEAARDHDYHRFYREEMSFRESAHYPPLRRLIRFVYSSNDEAGCKKAAANLRAILEHAIEEEGLAGSEIIGPAPCFIAKVKNQYYWQLIARSGPGKLRRGLHPLLDHVPPGWTVDVDPVDLL